MRVVAAMSGGVDSSVMAGLLVEAGHDVVGVHMKLHDVPAHPSTGSDKHCCGLDDSLDARSVADALGIPFYVMDLRQAFKRAVMDDFAEEYRRGRTPNPCIRCNGVLKFRVLLQRAKALGASHLATGHYARIHAGGALQRARDLDKDQSYFLFPVTRDALNHTLFPLGDLTKPEVRAHAERLGLRTAHKPESQEVCFIPDDDHTRFVREQSTETDGGNIVLEDGTIVGQHDGYYRFTIGQRRGLGVALGKPAYVIAIRPDTREVVVGPPERLRHARIVATGTNWYRRPSPGTQLQARIRHRGHLLSCTVDAASDDAVTISFATPARAAARGQALVLYEPDGDIVVGGGWIQEVTDA